MRPSDLKSPFISKDKSILIEDRILYIPEKCKAEVFPFPGWHSLFSREAPLKIEYGSGNGDWIVSRALEDPTCNWVAIEMDFERVRKIWSKRENHQVANLFIVCGEAATVTTHYFHNDSVEEIFINFPDPWPKRRHARYRLIQPKFIGEIDRILVKSAPLTLVTDDIPYSKQFISAMFQFSNFKPCFSDPYYITEHPTYGSSYFERLWRERGKEIRYHQFRKVL